MDSIARVATIVGDTPHMTREQADRISSFILENRIQDILELGFRHGVSTAFMAATLAQSGSGRIVTVDQMDDISSRPESTVVKEVVVVEKPVGLGGAAIELARRLRGR